MDLKFTMTVVAPGAVAFGTTEYNVMYPAHAAISQSCCLDHPKEWPCAICGVPYPETTAQEE